MPISIRTIQTCDLPAIMAIQAACYPDDFLESITTFSQKQQHAPATSWLIELQGEILGYLFCHPWHGATPPALDSILPNSAQHDRFYLHDLAIHPQGRGHRLAQHLVEHAINWAKAANYSQAMLVAVLDARTFWQKHGFVSMHSSPDVQQQLQHYGDAAVCMTRTL